MLKEYQISNNAYNYIIICNENEEILQEVDHTKAFLDNKDALKSTEVDNIKDTIYKTVSLINDPIFKPLFNLNIGQSISNSKVTITRLK